MKVVRFYHRETGMIGNNRLVVSDEDAVALNTPPDHLPLEESTGVQFDHLSQRIAVEQPQDESGRHPVVDYQPPQPSVDHEWHAQSKRWRLNASAAEREALRRGAAIRIRDLEQREQPRALREHALGKPEGTKRLQAIEDEIAGLRGQL